MFLLHLLDPSLSALSKAALNSLACWSMNSRGQRPKMQPITMPTIDAAGVAGLQCSSGGVQSKDRANEVILVERAEKRRAECLLRERKNTK